MGKNKNLLASNRSSWIERGKAVGATVGVRWESTVRKQVTRDEIRLFIPMRQPFTPPGMARIKATVAHVGEDTETSNPFSTAGRI